MAYYAALVQLVRLLEEINNPDHPYSNSLLDLDKQRIASLSEKFNFVEELLQHYSRKYFTEESADILERRIRDAAFQAQDIIESHISNQLLSEDSKTVEGKPRRLRKQISWHLISAFKKALKKLEYQGFGNQDNQGLKKVEEEVTSIVEELIRIKESHTSREHLPVNINIVADHDGASDAEALRDGSTMVGFEEYMANIKDQLCGQSYKREVISIVGMGGLGKSTLARNIFDDKLVDEYFYYRAWVTVSQDYKHRNILLAIANSLKIKNRKDLIGVEEGLLADLIHKRLKGMRYLIVLDDMWENKVWDDVKMILPNDKNGSRVITTTRLLTVANYAGNSKFIHELQFLNEDQSWNLFCQKVFCPPKLKDIGRSIVKRCRGLPLAIVVVAGLLSKASSMGHWEDIARDVSWAIDQNGNDFSKVLALSYNHLPHHLKPCFLYIGGFPEDYEIRIPELINLWVAEGFVKPNEYESLEEVAEKYLEDLVNRNLVLVTWKDPLGKFALCSIHDLLRELCLQRARYESFFHCLDRKNDFPRELVGNVRRFYIHMWNYSSFHMYRNDHASHVRAVLFFGKDSIWRCLSSIVSSSKLLRVLDTRSIESSKFPNGIVELLHLRYLAVGGSKICIPPSIFKLQNLQTLVLDGETILPSEIWKMPHLRHVIGLSITLPPIPYGEIRIVDGVPLLGRLQTLETIENFKFTRDTIEMIPNLKILKTEFITSGWNNCWEEFRLNNLVHLRQLEELEILVFQRVDMSEELPENFAFPSTLIKLTLLGCRLSWKEMTIVGSLPSLHFLELQRNSFVGEEWETKAGEFPRLKFLRMIYVDLKNWRVEESHFPCLEQLEILSCEYLKDIPPGIGDIPTLQCIRLYKCNSALVSSAFRIQEEQVELGNYDFQVRVVPQNISSGD